VPDHLGAHDGMVRCAFQTWLLRSSGRTILIDTGIGNDKTRPAVALWDHLRLDYLGNLARAGPANNPDIAGGVNDNAFDDSVAPVHAAGRVQLWEGSHTVDANLRLETAPGHTPGSSVVKLGWAAYVHALVLPAHVSGHSAFEVEDRGDGFAIKSWAPIERY
jgi:glyoxylase-like metal-dependent hydrolase (beta-lactamase superfamily II)